MAAQVKIFFITRISGNRSIAFFGLAIKGKMGEGGGKGCWGETYLVSYFWETECLVRCQFYKLQGLRRGKWINLYQIENTQP